MNTQLSQKTSMVAVIQRIPTTYLDRLTHPVFQQRIENAALCILLLIAYNALGFAWWLLAVLILVPDLSICAYAKGKLIGARVYNLAHNYTAPILLVVAGSGFGIDVLISIALIWGIHIVLDRALGYGLKYPTSFRHNHLTWK